MVAVSKPAHEERRTSLTLIKVMFYNRSKVYNYVQTDYNFVSTPHKFKFIREQIFNHTRFYNSSIREMYCNHQTQ